MTEKSKRVDYEMKYIGWNIGATRVERHETKGGIELLELKIDGVDVLKQLEKAEKWDYLERIKGGPPKGDKLIQWHIDMSTMRIKLEAIKAWLTYAKAQGYISISQGERLDEILKGDDKEEAEG